MRLRRSAPSAPTGVRNGRKGRVGDRYADLTVSGDGNVELVLFRRRKPKGGKEARNQRHDYDQAVTSGLIAYVFRWFFHDDTHKADMQPHLPCQGPHLIFDACGSSHAVREPGARGVAAGSSHLRR